ncbi:aromatic acid exporter family protein [Geomicrobium sp. JCM 19039]|uniref:FUSC family protein n=1 Tax=Geomicrobium sp. JCM 19039 TaxID=1460636 RepID=UPI00045F3403|nr:aromatic acid exporter family protein [Geomicrobium sp. JCM 19039]GAK13472.1 putative lipoprotein [Geomicrobium sp. JCM 19039]
MRLGARIFKTGLAIMLALYAAEWLGLEPAFFAGLTAAFAIQPSIYKTYQTILEQLQANVIGAILAIVFGLAFGHEPFVIGVVVMLAIAIIMKMNLESSTIPVTLVTIIIIMGSAPNDEYVLYSLSRFGLIMVGVFSAFLINLLFIPPKYEEKLYKKVSSMAENTSRWIRLTTRHDTNIQSRRKDLEASKEELVEMDQMYLLYKEERNYFQKNKFNKARKLVLFREMISVNKEQIGILSYLDDRENAYHHLPEQMQRLIQQQLDHLTNYHERILMRYDGKVNTQMTETMAEEVDEGNISLTDSFMDSYDYKEVSRDEWLSLLPIVSHIVEYNQRLEHLDRLVESFFSYHNPDDN